MRRRTLAIALLVAVALVHSGSAIAQSPPLDERGCTGADLCVGAAKMAVSPDAATVRGVPESRAAGLGPRLQRFHLGGYGVNPLQSAPDPDGSVSAALTRPADIPAFTGSRGPERIWVRAMVISQPRGPVVALVTLDAIGAGNVIQQRLTQAVAKATGIPAANVLFGQTHTHAGPDLQGLWGGVPQSWIADVLYPGAVQAVQRALELSVPARIDVRSGQLDEYNRYRRPRRLDPEVQPDRTASLVQARSVGSDRVVASLLQFDAHPTSVDEDIRAPHPDYILGAMDWIERYDGGTALYFNGPIADASPAGARPGCNAGGDDTYGTVRCRGEGIARATMAIPRGRPLAPTLSVRHESVVLPVTNPLFLGAGAAGAFNRYYDFLELPVEQIPLVGPMARDGLIELPQLTPTAQTAVSRITIGGADHGLELVTIPGEATGTFGRWIRDLAARDAHVVLLGLTQNSFGYILPEEEFSYVDERGDAGLVVPFTGYEEFVSLGPLTAPLLRAEGYVPLFDADPQAALPPVVERCRRSLNARPCLVWVAGRRLAFAQAGLASQCIEAGAPAALCDRLRVTR